MTQQGVLDWLAQQRRTGERAPAKVVKYGEWVIETGKFQVLGDELWSFLEQVASAALELGNFELAEVRTCLQICISRLNIRFPGSSRVAVLRGMTLEARGRPDDALRLYDAMLVEDPNNIMLLKRRVAALKEANGAPAAAEALARYVDVFPADVEAWLELAHIYIGLGQYAQAAYVAEEVVLLAPVDSYALLFYAETLYMSGETATAYKIYLRILEIANGDVQMLPNSNGEPSAGPWVRSLWGLKAVRIC